MKAQRLFSYVRRATDDYNMINDGDKIAVGISGGKDSLTLLYALCKYSKDGGNARKICILQL